MFLTVGPERYSAPPVETWMMPSLPASAKPWSAALRVCEDVHVDRRVGEARRPWRGRASRRRPRGWRWASAPQSCHAPAAAVRILPRGRDRCPAAARSASLAAGDLHRVPDRGERRRVGEVHAGHLLDAAAVPQRDGARCRSAWPARAADDLHAEQPAGPRSAITFTVIGAAPGHVAARRRRLDDERRRRRARRPSPAPWSSPVRRDLECTSPARTA